MKCHYCGAEISGRFCLVCGTRRDSAPGQKPVPAEREQVWQPFPERMPAEEKPVQSVHEVKVAAPEIPRIQLPTGRGLAKMIFLGILTLGIYPTVIWSRIVTELNIAASRYDGERTMPYFAMALLSPVTLFVYLFVWFHGFSRRVGEELDRRGLEYRFGAGDFWLWNILGALILVGPFVYVHKLMKAMNLINDDFNIKG